MVTRICFRDVVYTPPDTRKNSFGSWRWFIVAIAIAGMKKLPTKMRMSMYPALYWEHPLRKKKTNSYVDWQIPPKYGGMSMTRDKINKMRCQVNETKTGGFSQPETRIDFQI